jgi:LPS sulfotransferase NodH
MPSTDGRVHGKLFLFVLAEPRSGGNALRAAISAADAAQDFGEVFNPALATASPNHFAVYLRAAAFPQQLWTLSSNEARSLFFGYLDWLADQSTAEVGAIGLTYSQLRLLDWPATSVDAEPHLLQLIKECRFPIVHLARRDWIAQHASVLLAKGTGVWVQDEAVDPRPTHPVTVDIAALLREFHSRAASEILLTRWLAGYPLCRAFAYESAFRFGDVDAGLRESLQHLGLSLSPKLPVPTRKIAPPVKEFVDNFDEVMTRLKGTPYEWLRALDR